MLSVLRLSNLAIVKQLEVEFGPGLNVVTGETGAGKSILLRAVSLLAGKRAPSDLIRHGEDRCEVEGLFTVDDGLLQKLCGVWEEAEELLQEESDLIIRRIVERSGRGRATVNGRMVTLSMLQKISAALFDITGQHQQQSLLDPSEHRRLLDAYDIPEKLLAEVGEQYSEWSKAERELNQFLNETSERSDYFRRIGLERDELEAAALSAGEREELETELTRLSSVETLGQTAEGAVDVISSDENGVELQLGRARALLLSGIDIDPALKESYELIDSAYQQVKEGRYTLSDYLGSLEVDPNRLEFLRERIAEIARLERKYRKSESELIAYLAGIQDEAAQFEAGHFDESHLREIAEKTRAALDAVEKKLTEKRRDAARRLEGIIAKELKALNMKRAAFEVKIESAPSSSSGADAVEFYLSANPGEPARPLAKVASGGELSRVLLVLKTLLNEKAAQDLQVFDEVDTGIGGAVAEVVGEKLKDVSRFSQVILVTHAPQIAALADYHKVVSKQVSSDTTLVKVSDLNPEERVDEVARMLAGKKVTAKFQDSARELLGHAGDVQNLKIANS